MIFLFISKIFYFKFIPRVHYLPIRESVWVLNESSDESNNSGTGRKKPCTIIHSFSKIGHVVFHFFGKQLNKKFCQTTWRVNFIFEFDQFFDKIFRIMWTNKLHWPMSARFFRPDDPWTGQIVLAGSTTKSPQYVASTGRFPCSYVHVVDSVARHCLNAWSAAFAFDASSVLIKTKFAENKNKIWRNKEREAILLKIIQTNNVFKLLFN